jgi:hypothetical protein
MFSYGTTDAYKAYPFNSLLQTFSGTLNGAQISNNLGQYKDIYLRTLSREVIAKCSSYTPSLPDGPFYDYSVYPGTNYNVFSTATNQGYDNKRIPRGSYVVDSITVVHNITGGGTNASTISTNVADTWTITVVCTTMEPFLATGFFLLPGKHDGAGGLLGANQISILITLDAQAQHLWSSSTGYITAIQLNSITNSRLYYKVTQPNAIEASKVPRMIVYPYKQWTYVPGTTGGTINASSSTSVTTTNVTFGRVPHKIYLAVRKIRTQQTWADSESFLPITNINITFGAGKSGLLSSASQRQLWLMTCENFGWDCAPTLEEFSGKINTTGQAGSGSASVVRTLDYLRQVVQWLFAQLSTFRSKRQSPKDQSVNGNFL